MADIVFYTLFALMLAASPALVAALGVTLINYTPTPRRFPRKKGLGILGDGS